MDDSIVQTAMELLDRGEAERALGLLGPYTRRCPEDMDGLLALGRAYGQLGELKTAGRIFTRVLGNSPDHGAALFRLGQIQMALHDPLSAEAFMRLAIHHAPGLSAAWESLANALQEQGRKTEVLALLAEAVKRFPEDVNLHRILLLSLVDNEACVHGREVADWLAEHAFGDYASLRALLIYALSYLDLDLAGRAVKQLWHSHFGTLLDDQHLLQVFLDACPAKPEHLVRGKADRQTCPACGAESDGAEAFGLVISADPLERLAALAAFKLDQHCPCGLIMPEMVASLVLFPECSIACTVSPGPVSTPQPGQAETVSPGELGEPESVQPEAGRWWLCRVPDTGGEALAASMFELSRDFNPSGTPDAEEPGRLTAEDFRSLGSGEFFIWFVSGAHESLTEEAFHPNETHQHSEELIQTIQAISLQSRLSGQDEQPQNDGLPAWMQIERNSILAGNQSCAPWPMDHVCRCGAKLEPFMFGTDPRRLYDPAAVDEAALAGRIFVDPETEQPWSGFVCDACGRAYSWALGVLPKGGER